MLTAMHDGMSTFFIVTTSDLIGLDSKTAKKLGFKLRCILFDFLKVSCKLRWLEVVFFGSHLPF